MSFPRYPVYKDSGVKWLGQVPAHWAVMMSRRIFGQHRNSALDDDEQLSATQKYGVLPQKKFMEMEDQKVTLALTGTDNFKHVEAGDFVISLRSFQGGIERSQYQGCVSPAYTVLRSRTELDGQYWAYLLKSKGFVGALQTTTEGIRDGKNISYEQFGTVLITQPPISDQVQIAAFLNQETAKIDALIAEQQRLIELLNEKRQAVISHAVTKGLNPNVPMKPSGIEWLGDVPENWDIQTTNQLKRRQTKITYGIVQAGPDIEGGVPYIRTSDMSGEEFRTDGYLRTSAEIDEAYSRSKVSAGDLVVAIRASLGKGLLVPEFLSGANLTQGTAKISPREDLIPQFLFFAFNSSYCQTSILAVAKGTTFLEITLDALRRIKLAVPPLSEQGEIVAHLISQVDRADALTREAIRVIDLLQERRSALISAAVTGQIDVRGFASQEAA